MTLQTYSMNTTVCGLNVNDASLHSVWARQNLFQQQLKNTVFPPATQEKLLQTFVNERVTGVR